MADDKHKGNEENTTDEGRRRFIKNTGMVAGGVIGGSILGGVFTNKLLPGQETTTKTKNAAKGTLQQARVFFSREDDFAILNAATERLFPKDDLGPGAIELDVPYFIDKQLAGSWGKNAETYMKDPFIHTQQTHDYQHKDTPQDKSGPNTHTHSPTPTPRYQSRMNRGEIILQGLRKLDDESQKRFKKKFVDADAEQQNEILQAFENGEVNMKGVAAVTFFNLLLQLTIEGAYSDPVYGGNKNMMGWKMKEYPGPRMSYLNDIENDEFIKMEQESLRDYQGS